MKQKIGRKILLRMKILGLSKNQVSIWAKISRTQLDSIIHGGKNYTIDILIRVFDTLDLTFEAKPKE